MQSIMALRLQVSAVANCPVQSLLKQRRFHFKQRSVPPGSDKDRDSRWVAIYEGELVMDLMATWIRQAVALLGWRGFDTL